MCALQAGIPAAGVASESSALPLRPSFPAHWTCGWVLPAFGSCPGVRSINYVEEMIQLDTVLGEPGDLWQPCCPEQKRENVKSKAVYRGSFGNPAGPLLELLGQSCRRHQKACGGSAPLLFKTLGEVGGMGRLWRRCVSRGTGVLIWAHLLVSEKLPRLLLWTPVAPTLALSSNKSLQMSLFSSSQQIHSSKAGSHHLFFDMTYPQPGWQSACLLAVCRLKGSGI